MDTSKIVIGQVLLLLLLLRLFSVAITTIATCFILLLLLLLLLQGAFTLLVELLVLRVYLRFAVLRFSTSPGTGYCISREFSGIRILYPSMRID